MAIAIITSFDQQFLDNGDVNNGGSVTVYAAGTTTPLTLYSDDGLSTTRTNPITLDSAGRHAMVYIAAGTAYKIVVKNSSGSNLYTRDNIDPGVAVGSGALPVNAGGTGATTAGGARTNLGVPSSSEVSDIASDVADIEARLGTTDETEIASGTTAQRPAGTAGALRYNSTLSQIEAYLGAWLPFLGSSGVLAAVLPAGSVVKSAYAEYTANSDLTTQIPFDDTIPQISEGTQIITTSFTPTSSTNLLRFRFRGFYSTSNNTQMTAALFKNSDTDALTAASNRDPTASNPNQIGFEYEVVAGSTSATTFSVRVGPGSAVTVRFNGTDTARRFGGAARATLVIEEIKV